MRKPHPPEEHARFSGSLRHYHRTGSQTQRSWDDWVNGAAAKPRRSKNWLKIIGIVGGALMLTGIITGLVIEMS